MCNGSATALSHTQAMCCLGVVLFPNRDVWFSAIGGPEMASEAIPCRVSNLKKFSCQGGMGHAPLP